MPTKNITKAAKPFLKWAGGKTQLIGKDQINSYKFQKKNSPTGGRFCWQRFILVHYNPNLESRN